MRGSCWGLFGPLGNGVTYFEGRKFIVQTDHSSLRHLPNQPSVNRRIWKWVSILQGYDMEIRHIPGKVQPHKYNHSVGKV